MPNIRTASEIRENFRDDKPGFDYTNAIAMLVEIGYTAYAADQYLFGEG